MTTFAQQLQHFPGCEPVTRTVTLKAYGYKQVHNHEALKAGIDIHCLLFRDKAPDATWFEVGQATITLTVYDQPRTTETREQLIEKRAEVLRVAAELNRQINNMTQNTQYIPSEQELADALDMQRTEPRQEAWKRSGEEA